jgi:type I restriction enzyme, R subunit
MATGSGKTFTAVNFVYRLIKHAKARRVLFLVDRNNLGRQALQGVRPVHTPDDGRKFSELYNVQHLQSNLLDDVSKVHITTIQRLYSMLSGEAEFDAANEETSLWEAEAALREQAEKVVRYNPRLPIESLRLHHHRRVPPLDLQPVAAGAGVFRRLPDRADGHAQQADLWLLQPEPGDGVQPPAGGGRWGQCGWRGVPHPHTHHRKGQHHREGLVGGTRDKRTRRERWEQLEDDFSYDPQELDREVSRAQPDPHHPDGLQRQPA